MNGDTMGRKRFARNRQLEKYVRVNSNGYVTYKHPFMDSYESFGKDIAAANEVANIINAKFSGESDRIKSILSRQPSNPKNMPSLSDVLRRFEKERVPELKWSKGTTRNHKYQLIKIEEYGGSAIYEETDVLFFNELIDACFTGASRRLIISLLRQIDDFAVGKGLRRGEKVCERILKPARQERKRQRIKDYAEFLKIRECAKPWEQDAMDFALITLQPREVLCAMDLSMVQGNKLRVKRGKTGVYIEIEIGPSLAPLISKRRKIAMRLGCRKLLCRAPVRGSSVIIKPDRLTRGITDAVIRSGVYEDNHPTLHEIRSLGARMYVDRGYDKQLIQNLMGHKDASSTAIYLNPDEPKYIKSKALLNLE